MAYRQNARALGRCAQCGEEPFARCPRCGKELCLDHLPVDGCCIDCELGFGPERARIREASTLGAGLSTLAAIGALLITDAPGRCGHGHPIPYIVLMGCAAAMCTLIARLIGAASLARARRAYVYEGPAHGDTELLHWENNACSEPPPQRVPNWSNLPLR